MFFNSDLALLGFCFFVSVVLVIAYFLGEYLVKRDIIHYFKRLVSRHNKQGAIEDLQKISANLEKYKMNRGWPFYFRFFRMPDEDLSVFKEIIEDALNEAQSADDVRQLKQKIAINETRIEEIMIKNYKWNHNQPGVYIFISALIMLSIGIFKLAEIFIEYWETTFLFF